MKKIIFLFFLINILIYSQNKVLINYKENEPLLGKGYYLTFGEIPIATYENTIGYFSTVEIIGKNLKIKEGLKKIIIKNQNNILKEIEIQKQDIIKIEDIELNGINISLKWDFLRKDQIGIMINQWDFEKKEYNVDIEYIYIDKIESMNISINMPKFNPEIYLDINPNKIILKKQEYNKKYLILTKIRLNDYDMEITKNIDNSKDFKVKLNSKLTIENENYLGTINLVPLIEKYPNIYLENVDTEDIFKNSKEVTIGVQLSQNLNFNSDYKILGNLLEVQYGKYKKGMLDKVIIINGKTEIKRILGLNNNFHIHKKIYLDNEDNQNIFLEKVGTMINNYKNLKIKIDDKEILIDNNGNSELINTSIGNLKVEEGKITLLIENKDNIKQGDNIKFSILSLKNEILEEILLQIYLYN